MSNNKLEGKVAIVTGGASGIGKATACLFADQSARMVVIGDVQDELGQQVAASIGSQKCSYIHCDVTDEEQVKAMVESTVQNYGQLDIMFSNAGIVRSRKSTSNQAVLDLDLAAFDYLFAVNVRGMAACVKHAARAMIEQRVRGNIICMASVAASIGGDDLTDYHMSKHAVFGLVRSASRQLGVHGIRVNSVSPYVVATPLVCSVMGMEAQEAENYFELETRLKGVVLKVKHVADAVLFLASHDSELVSGHDMVVDAGFLGKYLNVRMFPACLPSCTPAPADAWIALLPSLHQPAPKHPYLLTARPIAFLFVQMLACVAPIWLLLSLFQLLFLPNTQAGHPPCQHQLLHPSRLRAYC
ncbi:hypothetical protein CRYUN_Cryun22dG0036500 [Craigia yunnanensis]